MKSIVAITLLGLALFAFGHAVPQLDSEGGLSTFDSRSGGLYVPDAEDAWTGKSTGASYGVAGEKKTETKTEKKIGKKTLTGGTATTDAKRQAGNGDSFSFAGVSERVLIPTGVGAVVSCILAIYFVLSRRARRKRRRPAVAVMYLYRQPTSGHQHEVAATDDRPRKAA